MIWTASHLFFDLFLIVFSCFTMFHVMLGEQTCIDEGTISCEHSLTQFVSSRLMLRHTSVGGLFSHCIFSSMKVQYLMNMQEDILVIHCSPQSVFRVRPATHCSPMLSSEPALPLVSSLKCTHIPRPGHASPILCTSFSPTGKLLATRSGDNNVWLWDLDTETELCEWRRGAGHGIISSAMYHSVQVTDMAVTL